MVNEIIEISLHGLINVWCVPPLLLVMVVMFVHGQT
jgi:hypothetical protein